MNRHGWVYSAEEVISDEGPFVLKNTRCGSTNLAIRSLLSLSEFEKSRGQRDKAPINWKLEFRWRLLIPGV